MLKIVSIESLVPVLLSTTEECQRRCCWRNKCWI